MPDLYALLNRTLLILQRRMTLRIDWVVLISLSFLFMFIPHFVVEAGDQNNVAKNASDVSEIQIDNLLNNLNAASRQLRSDAERKLIKFSTKSIPYLKQKLDEEKLTASESNSLERVVKKIEEREIQKLKKPTKINVPSKGDIQSVMKLISEKTGFNIDPFQIDSTFSKQKLLKQEIQFPQNQMTFWQVLNHLENQLGIRWDVHKKTTIKSGGKVALVPTGNKETGNRFLDDDGVFRIVLNLARIVPLSNDKKNFKLRLKFEVISEPRVFPLILFLKTKNMELVTDNGVYLPPFSPDSQIELSPEKGSHLIPFHIDYVLSKSQLKELKSINLQGSAKMLLATHQELFQIDLNENGKKYNRHLLSLKIQNRETERIRNGSEAFRLNLIADFDLNREKYEMLFESHRRDIFRNSPYLIHRKTGERINTLESHNKMIQDSNLLLYHMEFRDLDIDKSQYQLQFPAYTIFEILPVHFQFKNVRPQNVTLQQVKEQK